MKTLKTIIKQLKAVDQRISELYSYQDCPYKQGHMICVNRSLDVWEPSKKNKNMLNTQYNKQTILTNELTNIINKDDLTEKELIQLLVDNDMQVDEAICLIEDII